MDDAVSLPLTITFDPLDELLAHGWDVVEYDPSTCVTPKKKKIISNSTTERAITKGGTSGEEIWREETRGRFPSHLLPVVRLRKLIPTSRKPSLRTSLSCRSPILI